MSTDAVDCGAAKEAVRAVLKDVIAANPALTEVRGVALFDPRKTQSSKLRVPSILLRLPL
jgi:hypothetical protein